MSSFSQDYVKKRKIYREFFEKATTGLLRKLEFLKSRYKCVKCVKNCSLNINIESDLPQKCSFNIWKEDVFSLLKNDLKPKLEMQYKEILEQRKNYKCSKCALCCNFACSEYSFDELKEKAKKGDNYAKQFVRVFVPYESIESARAVFPEYVSLLEIQNPKNSIHIYYCRMINAEKLCPDYENRPQICKDFPDNPLLFLHPKCGFSQWKDSVEIKALSLMALIEVVDFYIQKIRSKSKS